MTKQLTSEAVRDRLRKAIRTQHAGMAAGWARAHDFSSAYVSMVLAGHKEPSARMCEALGVTKEAGYTLTENADAAP